MKSEKTGESPEKEEVRPSWIRRSAGPYLRELSIVIIGVLITLMITSVITSHNRQKELTGMLRLVRAELDKNREELEWTAKRWHRQQYTNRMLLEWSGELAEIPEDTLAKYSDMLGALHLFIPETNAYETLKGSVLAQYVKETGLLQELARVYDRQVYLEQQLNQYSSRKSHYMNKANENMTYEEVEQWSAYFLKNGNIYDYYYYTLRDPGIRSFMLTGGTILPAGIFESVDEDMESMIYALKDYGY